MTPQVTRIDKARFWVDHMQRAARRAESGPDTWFRVWGLGFLWFGGLGLGFRV